MSTQLPYQEEQVAAIQEGAAMMYEMVRASIDTGQMPPRDVMDWFARVTVYQFISLEFISTERALTEQEMENMQAARGDLDGLMKIAERSKLFALQATINDILRTRMLRLPEGYRQQLHHITMLPR